MAISVCASANKVVVSNGSGSICVGTAIRLPASATVTVANVGTGEGEIFRDKIATTVSLRTITGIGGLVVSTSGDLVRIDGTAVTGIPGGTDTQLQFNDGGSFGGAGLYWDGLVLGFGGLSSADSSLKGVGTSIHARLGDNSDWAGLSVGTVDAYGVVTVVGQADTEQLVIRANATQAVTNPLVLLQDSTGTPILAIHSDGADNIFLGVGAGASNTASGTRLVFIGQDAGGSSVDALSCVAVGTEALASNVTSNQNTAVGTFALNALTGDSTTGVGSNAGRSISSGLYNTILGADASRYNEVGSANTCLGRRAGFGVVGESYTDNTIAGAQACDVLEDGSRNSVFGRSAGSSLTSGDDNLLAGWRVGDNLTTGSRNIILGYNLDASAVDVDDELNIGGLITGDLVLKTVAIDGTLDVYGEVDVHDNDIENVNSIKFDLTPVNGAEEGRLIWDATEQTLSVGMPGGNVNLQIGQEHLIRVKNVEGSQIDNGQVVIQAGNVDGTPTVVLADNSSITTAAIAGMATEDIANNQFGYITAEGKVNDLDTSAWPTKTPLYVGTNGDVVAVRPAAPLITSFVGQVIRQNNGAGNVYLRPTLVQRISYASDCNIRDTVLGGGDMIAWDLDNLRWDRLLASDVGSRNGFPNRTDSVLAWTDTGPDRTLSIQPTGASFDYFVDSIGYTSTGDTLQIDDTEGVHFIYYDGSILAASVNPDNAEVATVIRTKALVAIVVWDATNSTATYVGEERHGRVMSPDSHNYLHFVDGMQYLFGLGLNTFSVDGTGTTADAQFGADAGGLVDEDIPHITSAVASTTGLPIYHLDGANGDLRQTVVSGFSARTFDNTSATRLAWNEFTGGAWQLTEVTNNRFVLYHVFGTSEKDTPIISIMGQDTYISRAAARTGASVEIHNLVINNALFPELRPLATVIYQTNTSYASAINAKVVSTDEGDDYVDWRNEAVSRTALSTSDHSALTGLGADDHAAYLLASDATDRATFASDWLDLTDAGATTLHKHDHGGMDGLGDDDHTQYSLVDGTRAFTGSVTIDGSLELAAAGVLSWASRSEISSPVDGQILLTNTAGTDFSRMMFGGTTSAFSALKRSAAELHARLADDSDYATFRAGLIVSSAGITAGTNLTVGPSGQIRWGTTRSEMTSPVDGQILLTDAAGTDFSRMMFGGVTSSYPSLKRVSNTLQTKLADDSAWSDFYTKSLFATTNIQAGTSAQIRWGSSTEMSAPADGHLLLTNAAGTAFDLLQLGGTTSSHVALKSVTNALQVRLGDDSAYGALTASYFTATRDISAGGAYKLLFTGSTELTAPSDGNLLLTDTAGTAFSLLQLGGVTAAYPAWKRVGAALHARLADDSDYAAVNIKSMIASNVITAPTLRSGATGSIEWNTRTEMSAPADGDLLLTNAAGTDFSRMMFGGVTTAFPAWGRSGTTLEAVLADGSAYTGLTAGATTIVGTADAVQLVVKANATQANDKPLMQFQDSAGNPVMEINSNIASNSFVGVNAGDAITTGVQNTIFGNIAGSLISEADGCTLAGFRTGRNVSTGLYNTAFGTDAMSFNAVGAANVCIGRRAGFGVTGNDYDDNTIVGTQAGDGLSTGSGNTLLGRSAGSNLTTGDNSILIGFGVSASAPGVDDELNIGNLITGDLVAKTIDLDGDLTVDGVTVTDLTASQIVKTDGSKTLVTVATLDHGTELSGLSDDDHSAYLLASDATSRAAFASDWLDLTDAGATTLHKHDHGAMDGLGDDDHTQYSLVTGTRAFTGAVAIVGSADVTQLVIKANATQPIGTPLIQIQNSAGAAVMEINSDGGNNCFIGVSAGQSNVSGDWSTYLGALAGTSNTTGVNNTHVGRAAGAVLIDGSHNVSLGTTALRWSSSGDQNTCIGYAAGIGQDGLSDFDNNTLIGAHTGRSLTTGSNNLLLGYRCGDLLTTGANNIIIGYDLEASAVDVSNELNIGDLITGDLTLKTTALDGTLTIVGQADTVQLIVKAHSAQAATNPLIQFQDSAGNPVMAITSDDPTNIAIGVGAADSVTAGTGNIIIGNNAAANKTSVTIETVCIGRDVCAGAGTNLPEKSVYIGALAGYNENNAGGTSVVIGYKAGSETTSMTNNTFVGAFAGQYNGGNNNVAVGRFAMSSFLGGDTVHDIDNCVCIGTSTGINFEAGADYNTLIGSECGDNITTGSGNICLGRQAGDNITTADDCIIIGHDIDADSATADDQLNIGGAIKGDLSVGDIQITRHLEIDGDLDHDGSGVGFYGTAPAAQSAAYTPTNVTPDRAYDANSTTVEELADVLGTLIADLQATGLLA